MTSIDTILRPDAIRHAPRTQSTTHSTTFTTMKPHTRNDSDSSERADDFTRMFLHAIKNDEIARSLREALGVHEQLAALHRELTTL